MFLKQVPGEYVETTVVSNGISHLRMVPRWAPTSQGLAIAEVMKRVGVGLREAARRCSLSMAEMSALRDGRAICVDATDFGMVLKMLEKNMRR